jgi:hypothetical protein
VEVREQKVLLSSDVIIWNHMVLDAMLLSTIAIARQEIQRLQVLEVIGVASR